MRTMTRSRFCIYLEVRVCILCSIWEKSEESRVMRYGPEKMKEWSWADWRGEEWGRDRFAVGGRSKEELSGRHICCVILLGDSWRYCLNVCVLFTPKARLPLGFLVTQSTISGPQSLSCKPRTSNSHYVSFKKPTHFMLIHQQFFFLVSSFRQRRWLRVALVRWQVTAAHRWLLWVAN